MTYSNGSTHLVQLENNFVLILTNKKGDIITTRVLNNHEAYRYLEIHSDLKLISY